MVLAMTSHSHKPVTAASDSPQSIHESSVARNGASLRRSLAQPDPLVVAAMALERVLSTSAPAAAVLLAVFPRFRHLDERHRSWASELVYTALRMRRPLEVQLSAHVGGDLPADLSLRAHLLVAAAELLYVDRIRDSSVDAIDVAVSQIGALRGPRTAAMVNGVLTRLLASQSSCVRDGAAR
jgi:transcription termination factor NusB